MAGKLGQAVTKKVQIGVVEVRLGTLQQAMKLEQKHSVGLLDDATIEVSQDSTDLMAGFPQTPFDTAITSQASSLTATAREYSRKNLQVMFGKGVDAAEPADVGGTMTTYTDPYSFATDITTGIAVGDLLAIYPEGSPSEINIVKVSTVSSGSITLANTITGPTADDTPMITDFGAHIGNGITVHVFKTNSVAIGDVQVTNYVSAMMVMQERGTARPIGYNYWKAAVSGGLSMQTSATDFSSFDLALKFLEPALSEYEPDGAPLHHLAGIIRDHPTGMFWNGGDI